MSNWRTPTHESEADRIARALLYQNTGAADRYRGFDPAAKLKKEEKPPTVCFGDLYRATLKVGADTGSPSAFRNELIREGRAQPIETRSQSKRYTEHRAKVIRELYLWLKKIPLRDLENVDDLLGRSNCPDVFGAWSLPQRQLAMIQAMKQAGHLKMAKTASTHTLWCVRESARYEQLPAKLLRAAYDAGVKSRSKRVIGELDAVEGRDRLTKRRRHVDCNG